MPTWPEMAHFMFGHDGGFWYAHPLGEINGLTEDQLFWGPDDGALCILWQVAHIAHRERLHITRICQGLTEDDIPPEYAVFGDTWIAADALRDAVEVDEVLNWARDVRALSHDYIASLTDEQMQSPVPNAEDDLTVAHWLMVTSAHCALHIGRIQALRAMIEGDEERAC